MRRIRHAQYRLAATLGVFAGSASGCTPEEQSSVAGILASSADAAISALITFAADFGRQLLAAFLF